eukprot:2504896-Rhodomonas_salina.2
MHILKGDRGKRTRGTAPEMLKAAVRSNAATASSRGSALSIAGFGNGARTHVRRKIPTASAVSLFVFV